MMTFPGGFPVYVINLDGSRDRFQNIETHLAELQIQFIRIAAIDGRGCSPNDDCNYDESAMRAAMGRSLLGGELGCVQSHRKALAAFLESKAEYAVILEDDARLAADFSALIPEIADWLQNYRPCWRVVNLGHPVVKIATPLVNLSGIESTYTLLSAHYYPMGAFALMWSRRGAEEYLRFHQKVCMPYDNGLQNWLCRAGQGYAVSPAITMVADALSVIDLTPTGAKPVRGKNRRGLLYGLRKQRRLWRNRLWAFAHKAGLIRPMPGA